MISSIERLILYRIRTIASARNSPTPIATVKISTILGTEGTCPANTCRSGSDTVIITPIKKPVSSTVSSFCILEICTPTPSPMGVIAISAPSWKNPIPIISINAPVRNITTLPSSIGIKNMLSISTIPVIGNTAASDSLIFSFSFTFNSTPTFQQSVLFARCLQIKKAFADFSPANPNPNISL